MGQVPGDCRVATEAVDGGRVCLFNQAQHEPLGNQGHDIFTDHGMPTPQLSALRRPSKARPSVTSSAYSKSPPTGSPDARRVTTMPMDFSIRAR